MTGEARVGGGRERVGERGWSSLDNRKAVWVREHNRTGGKGEEGLGGGGGEGGGGVAMLRPVADCLTHLAAD